MTGSDKRARGWGLRQICRCGIGSVLLATAPLPAITANGSDTASGGSQQTSALESVVAELLGILRQAQMLPAEQAPMRRAVLRAILEHSGCRSALVPSTAGADPLPAALGAPRTVAGHYAYLRILRVGPGFAAELAAARQELDGGNYKGLILDVRAATGDEPAAAAAGIAAVDAVGFPMAVLVNADTRGAAEVFADLSRQRCSAYIVGQPTGGYPVAWSPLTLVSGDVVRLPVVTENAGKRAPIQPDIVVTADLSAPGPGQSDPEPATDLALRRAVDLLTTMQAFRRPGAAE